MSAARWVTGDKLNAEDRVYALAAFVHRFTAAHVPAWALKPMKGGLFCNVQHATDADWLAHTRFAVRRDGSLDCRVRRCESTPTWPEGSAPISHPYGKPPAPLVTLRMPAESWATLRETLEMDSHSSAFDSSLREEISEALETVEEVKP